MRLYSSHTHPLTHRLGKLPNQCVDCASKRGYDMGYSDGWDDGVADFIDENDGTVSYPSKEEPAMHDYIVSMETSNQGRTLLVAVKAEDEQAALTIAHNAWGYEVTGVARQPAVTHGNHSSIGHYLRSVERVDAPHWIIEDEY